MGRSLGFGSRGTNSTPGQRAGDDQGRALAMLLASAFSVLAPRSDGPIMQKVPSNLIKASRVGTHTVSRAFHSRWGLFHLSLAVLVHYRIKSLGLCFEGGPPASIALAGSDVLRHAFTVLKTQ